MTVTALKQQIKNSERVSVFVDGKYSFSLGYNDVIEHKIKLGLELNEPRIKELEKLSAEGKLKARALNWVLGRPHSIKEFRNYMQRQQTEPDFVNQCVDEFSTRNYLNDEAFARWWLESRRRSKLSSTKKLQLELRFKGISQETIQLVLDEENQPKEILIVDTDITEKKQLEAQFLRAQRLESLGTLAGGNTFRFANSSGATWATGEYLSIWNWTAGSDHLFFGDGTGTGLQQSQLDKVKFYSDAGTTVLPWAPGFSGFTGGGEVIPVPEPGAVAAPLGLLGLIAWRERRKAAQR